MNIHNPKTIIIAGLICFAVALAVYLYFIPGVIYSWFGQLPFLGQSAVVLLGIILVWLFVSQTVIRKRK